MDYTQPLLRIQFVMASATSGVASQLALQATISLQ